MDAARAATGITVNVLLFAQLRGGFGTDELTASLPNEATGAELLAWLSQRNPTLAGLLDVSRLAVNCEYVSLDHRLQDGDEVVVMPPVSGG
ncbi:MAG: molybdopterin converting factor subunit 1 [Candidatus Omnitrophica bacterium]|nr:molybdopterin converting factor subunit 1 [Candidatus Omnitrophota bacterium]